MASYYYDGRYNLLLYAYPFVHFALVPISLYMFQLSLQGILRTGNVIPQGMNAKH